MEMRRRLPIVATKLLGISLISQCREGEGRLTYCIVECFLVFLLGRRVRRWKDAGDKESISGWLGGVAGGCRAGETTTLFFAYSGGVGQGTKRRLLKFGFLRGVAGRVTAHSNGDLLFEVFGTVADGGMERVQDFSRVASGAWPIAARRTETTLCSIALVGRGGRRWQGTRQGRLECEVVGGG